MRGLILTTASLLTLANAVSASAGPDGRATVVIDSIRHEVTIRIGPFDVGASPGYGDAQHGYGSSPPPLARFDWPVDGWLRGARLRYLDADGQPLPATVGHHANLINFSRRQLLYSAYERLVSWGPETGDMRLPASVGVPVRAGSAMGVTVYWHNMSGRSWQDATVEIVAEWTPTTQNPRPVDVLIEYVNVVYPVGESATFDVPVGASRQAASFTQPIDARILAAGGHLHDHAVALALRAPDGRPLFTLDAVRQDDGQVSAVERIIPGLRGEGIRLRAGHRYTLEGTYRNDGDRSHPAGGMVNLVLLIAPDRNAQWPAIDGADPELARDLAYLEAHGTTAKGHH